MVGKEDSIKEVPGTKVIVPSVRRKVLKDVWLVFSGDAPINTPSRAYLVACSLGTFVTDTLNKHTHAVATRLGTDKVWGNLVKLGRIKFSSIVKISLVPCR